VNLRHKASEPRDIELKTEPQKANSRKKMFMTTFSRDLEVSVLISLLGSNYRGANTEAKVASMGESGERKEEAHTPRRV